ncbi:MAG: hypothetical protein JRH19_02710 [Deltaproteobacteria bacterium]|nr:hypothetical protein [Deltaproteobacteria bacterium]
MFVGHYSAAFAAKGLAPRVPLWALLLAAQFVDVLWAGFVLAGVERVRLDPSLPSNPLDLVHMPFTHGLLATVGWTALAWGVGRRWLGPGRRALALAGVVASHWFLDLLVHRPDLPLLYAEPRLGLALWNRPAIALALELALFGAGVAFCLLRGGVSQECRGRLLWLAAGLLVLQLATLSGSAPPQVPALVSSMALLFALVALAGAWVERGRGSAALVD